MMPMPACRRPLSLPASQQEADGLGYWQIVRIVGLADLKKPVPSPGHYGSLKRLAMRFAGYKECSTVFESSGLLLAQFVVLSTFIFMFFFLEHNLGVLSSAIVVIPPALVLFSLMMTWPTVLWFRAGGWEQVLENEVNEQEEIAVHSKSLDVPYRRVFDKKSKMLPYRSNMFWPISNKIKDNFLVAVGILLIAQFGPINLFLVYHFVGLEESVAYAVLVWVAAFLIPRRKRNQNAE
jgi:hypothetical protein